MQISNALLMFGDCLERMKEIPDQSVDLILADPPHGSSQCKWDSVIPFGPMWAQLKRVLKPNAAIVLFSTQPFTSTLIASNLPLFKYNWVWQKTKAGNFLQIKNMPATRHEDICVFSTGVVIHKGQSKRRMPYYPVGVEDCSDTWTRPTICSKKSEHKYYRPSHKRARIIKNKSFPSSILKFASVQNIYHPTQKPVALLEYLIKTYSQEGDIVLDFTMGSGSTGVACIRQNRRFIGIENEPVYFKTARRRIKARYNARNRT